ncbi:MAG: hypothetical protein AB7G12_05890 [Thermoanaerobaculia bacterium]
MIAAGLLFAALLVAPGSEAAARPSLASFAATIGPADARAAIAGVVAIADADGPRGKFLSEMISLRSGELRFRLEREESASEFLYSDGAPWSRAEPGGPLQRAAGDFTSFLRGHEVHRMLLDLETRFRPVAREAPAGCLPFAQPDGLAATICATTPGAPPSTIELTLPDGAGGGTVTLELADWRALHGVRLPFAVDFVHAGERHTYRYTAVLPFRLSPGTSLPRDPEARFARLGDFAALALAHERALVAHRRSEVAGLAADEAPASLSSGRGTLHDTGRDSLATRLGSYFAGVRFARYEDVAIPAIAVADDGSLGWLACAIEAAGETVAGDPGSAATPFEYAFSWVELYARQEGRWLRVGNASSARP